jgi:hypothetical protein
VQNRDTAFLNGFAELDGVFDASLMSRQEDDQ